MTRCGVETRETASLYLSKWEFRGILSYNEGMCNDRVLPIERGKQRKPEDIA
jgi:hypothetical protein